MKFSSLATLQCSQWWKCNQNDNISISVFSCVSVYVYWCFSRLFGTSHFASLFFLCGFYMSCHANKILLSNRVLLVWLSIAPGFIRPYKTGRFVESLSPSVRLTLFCGCQCASIVNVQLAHISSWFSTISWPQGMEKVSLLLTLCEGIKRSSVVSSHKGSVTWNWVFMLAWTSRWTNCQVDGELMGHDVMYWNWELFYVCLCVVFLVN